MRMHSFRSRAIVSAVLLSLAMVPMSVLGQTRIEAPKNKYKVQDDVKLGNEAAAQVEQQFPILNDAEATRYVERVGSRLVLAIPPEFRQTAFNYRFKVVNASDINAFALPGGPMYVNRGMIEAARNEGEMAGVMAHEISHVALRHATAQQTKLSNPLNQVLGIGAILGGAILGGQTGAQLGQIFAQGYFLKYSREYENQADLLGSHIMANAGYDPHDLANMFQTINKQGGGRAPEWLSSHPDPGNRYEKINNEAALLNVSSEPIKITREFERVQARLRAMPKAPSMSEIEKNAQSGQTNTSATAGGRYSRNVPRPSTSVRNYSQGDWLSINVPSNWESFPGRSDVQFAPAGAYGDQGITHGAMIGVYEGGGGSLRTETEGYLQAILSGNEYLKRQGGLVNTYLGGRQAYLTVLSGRSTVTGRTEEVRVYTTSLRNGSLFYLLTVVPGDESSRYYGTFRNIVRSVRLND